VLCGFSVAEIAQRLFISQDNVHKRYQRAKKQLAAQAQYFNQLSSADSQQRLNSVLKVIYSLFSEGYLSSCQEVVIRRELCEEAMRLANLLASKVQAGKPSVYALQALMAFNYARLDGRQNHEGLLLLEEQPRTTWDKTFIDMGVRYLALSASGTSLSHYHLEAAIAGEHCRAARFDDTNWALICAYYEQLDTHFPSYLYRLNRVVALAQWKGAAEALTLLDQHPPPEWLSKSYLWYGVAADLNARCGNHDQAEHFYQLAQAHAPNKAIQRLLSRRFEQVRGAR